MDDLLMAVPVDPPALVPRDTSTLLTTAAPIAGLKPESIRLGSGIKFRSNGTQDLQRMDTEGTICPVPDDGRTPPESTADIIGFGAFSIFADESCTVLSIDEDDLRRWDSIRLSAFESAQVAAELLDAAATGNWSLTHSTAPGTPGDPPDPTVILNADAVSPSLALTLVENELAARLHGARGMIHVTPGILYQLNEGGGLDEEEGDEVPDDSRIMADLKHRLGTSGDQFYDQILQALTDNAKAAVPPKYDRWITPAGNIVVADAGYTGVGPGGAPDEGEAFIYGSGLVEVTLGPVRQVGTANQSLDILRNTRSEILERDGIVRFDPQTVFAVKVQGVVAPD